MKKNLLQFLALAAGLSFLAGISYAQPQEVKPKSLQAIEFFTGFAQGHLKEKGSYTMSPFIFDFDFDLKPLTKKIGLNPWGLFQFQLEPYISPTYAPDANIELGSGFILKMGILPDTYKFQPYLKAGPGMLYMSQHTNEQATQFNFFEYGALGAHYFFRKNLAFTVEGRYRHLSNSGIDDPNDGINSYFALLGFAYQF